LSVGIDQPREGDETEQASKLCKRTRGEQMGRRRRKGSKTAHLDRSRQRELISSPHARILPPKAGPVGDM
jgi:hypothetical protein